MTFWSSLGDCGYRRTGCAVEITRNVLESGVVLVVMVMMITRGCIVAVKECAASQRCRGGAGGGVVARVEGSLLVVEGKVVEVQTVGLECCSAGGGWDVLVDPLGGGDVLKVGERMWPPAYRHVLRRCNPS